MTDAAPLDPELVADLTAALAPEHVDPDEELDRPDWTPGLVPDDDGLVEVEGALGIPEKVRPRWRVDTDERADYALRRVAMYDEEVARVKAVAARQREQLEAWETKRLADVERARAFFHGAAADYGRRLREADPKFRTLPLPCGGKVTAHDTRAGVEVEDAEAFTTWALRQGHDDCVKVEMTPKLREIASRYTVQGERFVAGEPGADAEVVPGIRPRPKGWKADATPPKV